MSPPPSPAPPLSVEPALARRLGPFDATMIVMGGIIGAGIFVNPAVVASHVHTSGLILGAWGLGGLVALAGAFVYAELAARRPGVGGQYAYLRDAFHPGVAFLYGWALLLVIQTGGMAACAITFARYFCELAGIEASDHTKIVLAVVTLTVLSAINCLGVRAGSNVQSAFMLTKIAAIALLVGVGWLVVSPASKLANLSVAGETGGWSGVLSALVPVIFAYGGWQTASFVTGEMKNPERDLPRGLLIGVIGVIVLYLAVAFVCLRALGVTGLAATQTPASAVMRLALGETGARLLALAVAISTVGFLSQSILTAPRVYYAMARDGVFFRAVGQLHPQSRVPILAIALQGAWAAIIAASGRYDQILDYVVSVDVLFFGLTAMALFVFRARARHGNDGGGEATGVRVPGHPWTTALFILACWAVSATTVANHPRNAGIGFALLGVGAVIYGLWKRPRRAA